MQIRQLRPEEYLTMENNMNIAFRFERNESPTDDSNMTRYSYGAFTDEGVMTSSVIANPYRCTYWGSSVGMCGVGGVATFPEYRREGHMRRLLPYVLNAAYDRGDVLSSLFPFSHPFYRKFGFENCPTIQFCEMDNAAFQQFPFIGKVRQYLPGEDFSVIAGLYSAFQKNHNFLCDRDENYWKHMLNKDPYVTHKHTYIFFDDMEQPRAYCQLEHLAEGGEKKYAVLDMAYLAPSDLRRLFGFFRMLAPSGNGVKCKLPADVNLFCFFPEPYEISVQTKNCGMLRVVNVEKALALYPFKDNLAPFAIRVRDDILPQNDHTYLVGGKGKVTLDDSAVPAIDASIQAVSQLLCGAADLQTLLQYREDITARGDVSPLLSQFASNPIFLIENF